MLAWLRTPRGSTTTATVVVVILLLAWLAPWSRPMPSRLPFASPGAGEAPAASAAGSAGTTPDALAMSPAAPAGSAPAMSVTTSPAGSAPVTSVATAAAVPGAARPDTRVTAANTVGGSGPGRSRLDPSRPNGGKAAGPGQDASHPGMLAGVAPALPGTPKVGTTSTAATAASRMAPAGSNTVTASLAPTPNGGLAAPAPVGDSVTPSAVPGSPQAPPASSAADAGVPGFDVVRVQPNGDAVIAGRGNPGSDVALMDGEAVIGTATIDGSGQFALLPPSLSAGSHYLTLRTTKPGTPAATSSQGVAVTVAANSSAKPLVALLAPDKPAEILSDGGTTARAAGIAQGPTSTAIQAVEAQEGGRFTASGRARAGSQCRVYLNGAVLADVTADKNGRWSVAVEKGAQPGRYVVRVDELDGAGKVLNRAEVPFDYPTAMVAGSSRHVLAGGVLAEATPGSAAVGEQQASAAVDGVDAGTASTGTAVVADLHTTKVVSGDSLWRISRKMLGHGIKYTEIYASNVTQIRNPQLIYPGQVFVVPSTPAQ